MSDWAMLTRPKIIPDQSPPCIDACRVRSRRDGACRLARDNNQPTVAGAAALEDKSWI
jgi:hypothetical protein